MELAIIDGANLAASACLSHFCLWLREESEMLQKIGRGFSSPLTASELVAKPTTKKKKGENQMKNHKNEPESTEPADDERTYGINHLNLDVTANDLGSDSE